MGKYEDLRQFISGFISGPNSEAFLRSIAEQLQKQQDLSIAVTDQLTISTATGVYLDKILAGLGITRPSELGMEDLAFRQMGIQINQAKLITEAIHTVLATFYGDEAVRAYATSGQPEPYNLAAGDDLRFILESGEVRVLTLLGDEFENIQTATAAELCEVITRFIRTDGTDGYAQVYIDYDTGLRYVRIFGGAKGPFSLVQIEGGRIQNKLEFPELRGTDLPSNTTVWEITRNAGSRHRFRWVSGPAPLLDQVLVDDLVMIYGPQFESVGFVGTIRVVNVRPPTTAPQPDAGFFEIEYDTDVGLSSSAPDVLPPPNTISNTYSITVTQNDYDDLKFFLDKKNTAYSHQRYALAWEPADSLLRIYMPATTKVVRRELIGSAHVHLLYGAGEFDGAFGSTTDDDQKIVVTSDYGIMYRQRGLDSGATGGQITYGITTKDIEYVFRESEYTHLFTTTPHGITGVTQPDGRVLSSTVISVAVGQFLTDDPVNQFLGPYMVDPEKNYTLTDDFVTLRERIVAGENKQSLIVKGRLPNEPGKLLFSLNRENEETPVKYLAAQESSTPQPAPITSISQNGTTVTVTTNGPHGSVVGEDVLIAGTATFNGTWQIDSAPSDNVYTFSKTPSAMVYESTGTSTPIVDGVITTLIMDSSYTFKKDHEVLEDVTLLSDVKAYEPAPDGSDYSFYVTGTAEGRVFAAQLMLAITALGINLEIIILYPSDEGLGNEGDSTIEGVSPQSDATFVWGGDNA